MLRNGSMRLPVQIFVIALFAAAGRVAAQGTADTNAPAPASLSNQDRRDIAQVVAKDLVADQTLRKTVVEAAVREQVGVATYLIVGFFVLFVLVIIGVALLQWRFQRAVEKVID